LRLLYLRINADRSILKAFKSPLCITTRLSRRESTAESNNSALIIAERRRQKEA